MRILHVIPYMHPSAGGPPVVVENFVRETSRLGHLSEIISTPLFCNGDEQILLQRLNELAPPTFLLRSGTFDFSAWANPPPIWREHSHRRYCPSAYSLELHQRYGATRMWSSSPTLRAYAPWHA